MKKSENMNGLTESEWQSVKAFVEETPRDLRIGTQHYTKSRLIADLDIHSLRDVERSKDTDYGFRDRMGAENFISMITQLAQKMGAASTEQREWDGEKGVETLPEPHLGLGSVDEPPALTLGYVGGAKYEDTDEIYSTIEDDITKMDVKIVSFADDYDGRNYKEGERRSYENLLSISEYKALGYDTDSPTFQWLYSNSKNTRSILRSLLMSRDYNHELVKDNTDTFCEQGIEGWTDYQDDPSECHFASIVPEPTGNDESRSVCLEVSDWETQADRRITTISVSSKWSNHLGMEMLVPAWAHAQSQYYSQDKVKPLLVKKFEKTAMFKEYIADYERMVDEVTEIVKQIEKIEDVQYKVSLGFSHTARQNYADVTHVDDLKSYDWRYCLGKPSPSDWKYYERIFPNPTFRILVSHKPRVDTQAHTVIPILSRLLNELMLYRDALNEITKALNECGPSSGALLHIRNIIAPFDYAQMEGEEE